MIITPTQDAPVAQNDRYHTDEDLILTITPTGVLSNDLDADGDPLTATLVTSVSHGNLSLNLDGSFSYTPTLNFYGPGLFTYQAHDGISSSHIALVILTVQVVNDPPVALDDFFLRANTPSP